MELGKDEVLALKKSRIVDLVDGDLEEIVDEARLADSFAGPNEDYCVELPGVGEQPNTMWPSGCLDGGGPRHLVFVRD